MAGVLTFSDPKLMDSRIVDRLAHASDLLLQGDDRTKEAIAEAIASHPFAVLIGTLRPLGAALFARFSVSDPDATARQVADELTELSKTVFGCTESSTAATAIEVAGQLVASDFDPVDDILNADEIAMNPVHYIVGVTQWIMTMSVILGNLTDGTGGAGIRWAAGLVDDPSPNARVILDPY